MYKKIAIKFFSQVINQADTEEEREVVIYGLEIMISTIINFTLLMLIGIVSHNITGTIIFLICLCSIRGLAGGFHANSYIVCLLSSLIVFSLIVLINPYVTSRHNMILLIGTGFAYFLILIFSPVLSGKRNYSVEEIHTIRKKVRILLLAEMVIAIVLYQINFEMYKFSMYAMFTEGVLEIMGIIKFRNLNKGKALKRIMNFTIAVATLTGGTCLFILHEPPLPKLLKERLEKN